MSDASRLIQMKKRIESADREKSRTEGRVTEIKTRLKKKGIKSLNDGRSWVQKKKAEIRDMTQELKDGLERIDL